MLADSEETEAGYRDDAAVVAGRLWVDAPEHLASTMLMPALPELLQRYPQLQVGLGVIDRKVDLVEQGLDCAIRVGEVRDDGLVTRHLGDLPVGSYASPGDLAIHGQPAQPADLAAHWLVAYRSGAMVDDAWEYVQAGRHAPPGGGQFGQCLSGRLHRRAGADPDSRV